MKLYCGEAMTVWLIVMLLGRTKDSTESHLVEVVRAGVMGETQ